MDKNPNTLNETTAAFEPAVNLPPYVVAYGSGAAKTYVFVVPGYVRPASWPVTVSLGNNLQQAWGLYSDLLHAMHTEQLKFERELHPATLKDIVRQYRESPEFDNAASKRENDFLDLLELWSELNLNPPIGSITPDHIYGFLLTYGDTHANRLALKSTAGAVFDKAIDLGAIDINAAALAPMPHPLWHASNALHPVHIFAYKAPVPVLAPK